MSCFKGKFWVIDTVAPDHICRKGLRHQYERLTLLMRICVQCCAKRDSVSQAYPQFDLQNVHFQNGLTKSQDGRSADSKAPWTNSAIPS